MRIRLVVARVALAWMTMLVAAPGYTQVPVTPAFTYQGLLNDGGALASGIYDIEFKLFDAAAAGAQIGGTITANNVGVIAGVVTIELNFGAGAFSGQARWLEIGVRPGASIGAYTVLTPRQAITAAPYASFAANVASLPAGAVMHFNLQSCPTGWSELVGARGRYLVGMQPGGTLAGSVGTALTNLENRATGSHTHGYEAAVPTSTGSGNSKAGYEHRQTDAPIGAVAGTNAPYIILLICQKD